MIKTNTLLDTKEDTTREYGILCDSISELYDYIKNAPKVKERLNRSDDDNEDFRGTKSLDEAMNFLKFGDAPLYEKFVKDPKFSKLKSSLVGTTLARKSAVLDINGVIPSVPHAILGLPKSMINYEPNRPKANILNIVILPCANCAWSKEDMLEAGLTYMQVIDLLERQGYRCNLWAGILIKTELDADTTECDDACYVSMIAKIKSDKEPLNIKKCIFPVANPSYLRRIGFRFYEQTPKEIFADIGYGCTTTNDYIIKRIIESKIKDAIIWKYDTTDLTIESTLNALKENFGIEVES